MIIMNAPLLGAIFRGYLMFTGYLGAPPKRLLPSFFCQSCKVASMPFAMGVCKSRQSLSIFKGWFLRFAVDCPPVEVFLHRLSAFVVFRTCKGNLQLLHCFAMRIHGTDFFKHELSLIIMNSWSLHGNSC